MLIFSYSDIVVCVYMCYSRFLRALVPNFVCVHVSHATMFCLANCFRATFIHKKTEPNAAEQSSQGARKARRIRVGTYEAFSLSPMLTSSHILPTEFWFCSHTYSTLTSRHVLCNTAVTCGFLQCPTCKLVQRART
jgi:hypothetical protein